MYKKLENTIIGVYISRAAKAYNRVTTADKAISAFTASGIFPFDQDIFTDEDFAPSSVTEQPLQEVEQQI